MSELAAQAEFQELDIVCPHCGARCSREAGELRRRLSVDCDACRRNFRLDADLLVCALHDLDVALEAEAEGIPPLHRH